MRKCIAFYHGGRNRPRWLPCPGHAAHHSALCRAHADALSGVVYGLGVLRTCGQYQLHKHGLRRYAFLDFEPGAVHARLGSAAATANPASEVRDSARADG